MRYGVVLQKRERNGIVLSKGWCTNNMSIICLIVIINEKVGPPDE